MPKLGLRAGERVLDVGCGWGAFAIHAAARHGVHVTGITLSPPQAELRARSAPQEAGVADRVDIRVVDYRELRGERVRRDRLDRHGRARRRARRSTRTPRGCAAAAPGGRLLNHGIARLRHGDSEAGDFSERYVFPDAAPLHLSRVLLALERAGLRRPQHVEGFRADYAETLRHWARSGSTPTSRRRRRLAGAERIRVWRLYLRAARNGFETGFTSIYQVRAALPGGPAPAEAPGRGGARAAAGSVVVVVVVVVVEAVHRSRTRSDDLLVLFMRLWTFRQRTGAGRCRRRRCFVLESVC